jgi:hypothetical protein
MAFKKGQSGNPATQFSASNQPENPGRKPKLPEIDVLLADMFGDTGEGKSGAEIVMKSLYDEARSGNVRAAEVLLNRMYGMVKQESDINLKTSGVKWIEEREVKPESGE